MLSSGRECPDGGDSADCLLQTLVILLEQTREDDHKQFNQIPITFALTVAIALAAATICFRNDCAGRLQSRRKRSSMAIYLVGFLTSIIAILVERQMHDS